MPRMALLGVGGALAGAIGGNDAFTKLLLHCDGADASTTFTDSSASAHSPTAQGNAQIDTAQSKFGGASGLLDGTGDRVVVTDHADWDLMGVDFTIDLWARWNVLPSSGTLQFFVTQEADGSNNWLFYLNNVGGTQQLTLFHQTTAVARGHFRADITLSTATWYHIAVEKTGTTTNFFQDGTKLTTVVDTAWGTTGTFADNLRIGDRNTAVGTAPFNGWMDEIRISKGIARYGGSNFTPPAGAYS